MHHNFDLFGNLGGTDGGNSGKRECDLCYFRISDYYCITIEMPNSVRRASYLSNLDVSLAPEESKQKKEKISVYNLRLEGGRAQEGEPQAP